MNEQEVDERYRRLSDRDSSRPSEAIRQAVLRHAAELAAQVHTQESSAPIEFRKAAANEPRWRVATYGGLAAAALAGLLIAPHFLAPSTAPRASLTPPPANTAERAATPAAKMPLEAGKFVPAEPRAFAGNVRPRQNPALGAVAAADASRAAQGGARENAAPAPQSSVAQLQTMRAPSAASPPRDAAPSPDAAGALREAAQSGNVPTLQALLADHIDIDARDPWGRTALMLAVRADQKEAVDVLLAAGADPNAADARGTTPLEAAAGAQPEIAAALRRAGAR
jgi:hypothetical protein